MKPIKTLEDLKETVEDILDIRTNFVRTSFDNKKKLFTEGLDGRCNTLYWVLDTDSGYFNIRVYSYNNDIKGCVRVYEHNKEFKVQIMRPATMKYSGISTFPSARKR